MAMNFSRKILTAVLAVILLLSAAVPVLASGETIDLVNMHDIGSDRVNVVNDAITDSYGNTYTDNILQFETGEDAYISYDLNGEYEQFNGTIVASTDTGSDAVIYVGIFGDGKLLYELKDYTRQKAAENVSIDVKGVGTLSVMTSSNSYWHGDLYFVNSSFTKSDEPSVYPSRSTVGDLVVIDSKDYNYSDRLFTDVFGNLHNGYVDLNNYFDETFVLYNLDKKYISLSGSIVSGSDTGSDASVNIKIYLDDTEIFSKTNITKTTPQIDFNLDVTNGSTLKIVQTNNNSGWYKHFYLTDVVLKVHEHTSAEWVVVKEATCTEDGEKTQTCAECGEVALSSKIPATGHTPDNNWVVEREATCSMEGEEVQHCTVCKEICDSRSIAKLAHTPEADWEIESEANCVIEGTEVKRCTVCGEIVETQAVPLTDHSYLDWEVLSGSIWNPPVIKERTCSVCGFVEHVESSATAWLKPLVIALAVIIIVGIAVIAIVRISRNKKKHAPEPVDCVKCNYCSASVKKGIRFCTSCGKPMEAASAPEVKEAEPAELPDEKFCTGCGAKVKSTAAFCTKCGKKLN